MIAIHIPHSVSTVLNSALLAAIQKKRAIFKLVSSFKHTDFSTPPAAKPIKLFVWGGASPHVTSWACSRHLIFNLSHERYTYRPFIRAVIIHYDAKE